MDNLTWTPITVRLSALDFWERNPKRLTKAQAKRLADSTDRLGRAGVLLVGPQDARGRYPLYDGHQRANIWRTLYGPDAEVHALQSNRELSEDERLSVSLLTVTAVGSFDFDALAGWDTGVLQDLGLSVDYKHELDDAAANIAAMLEALRVDGEDRNAAEDANAEARLDIADELQAKWQVQPGDLWQLGEHRLICGDCTDPAIVARVMGRESVQSINTDPPYGIGKLMQGGTWAKKQDAQYSKMREWDRETSQLFFDLILSYGVPSIVWGGNYFTTPPSRCWLIWDKPEFPTMSSAELAWTNIDYVTKRKEFPRTHQVDGLKYHPTQKPVELIIWSISFLPQNTSIYDPFCGSGTTIIACERLGRKCRAVEISPAYVAVTLQRWADATGGTPVRLENAE